MIDLPKPYVLFIGDVDLSVRAKIAHSLAYFCSHDCVGVVYAKKNRVIIDGLPELTLAQAREKGARSMVLATVNPGGMVADTDITYILQAIDCGLDVISGMHTPLSSFDPIRRLAQDKGVQLHELRCANTHISVATGKKRSGKRILTVGTDCSSGKMYTSLTLHQYMQTLGIKSQFVATGQTGILIAGSGIAVDHVISDFTAGAAEQLSPATDDDAYYVIEGQGSLFHPSFAGVSLSLLHGSQPDYIILCHDPLRTHVLGTQYVLPGIAETIEMNLSLARLTNPCVQCVGVSINSKALSLEDANQYILELEQRLGLPVTDPCRFGVKPLTSFIG